MNNSAKNSQVLSDSVRKLSSRQLRAIVFLISCPTQEEACRNAGVTRETINTWMKDPVFKEELENSASLCSRRRSTRSSNQSTRQWSPSETSSTPATKVSGCGQASTSYGWG